MGSGYSSEEELETQVLTKQKDNLVKNHNQFAGKAYIKKWG